MSSGRRATKKGVRKSPPVEEKLDETIADQRADQYNLPTGLAVALMTGRGGMVRLSADTPWPHEQQKEIARFIGDLIDDRDRLGRELEQLRRATKRAMGAVTEVINKAQDVEHMLDRGLHNIGDDYDDEEDY